MRSHKHWTLELLAFVSHLFIVKIVAAWPKNQVLNVFKPFSPKFFTLTAHRNALFYFIIYGVGVTSWSNGKTWSR